MRRHLFPTLLTCAIAFWLANANPYGQDIKPGVCILPPNEGVPCDLNEVGINGLQPHFYYDTKLTSCKQFFYRGCGGNGNNFGTKALCVQRCVMGAVEVAPGATSTDHDGLTTITDSCVDTLSTTSSSTSAPLEHCAGRRLTDEVILMRLDSEITPLLQAPGSLGDLCERDELMEANATTHQLRELMDQLNTTLTAIREYIPSLTINQPNKVGSDESCLNCRSAVTLIRAHVDMVKSVVEKRILDVCAESDAAKRCALFGDVFLQPAAKLVNEILDEELLCHVIYQPCVRTNKQRARYNLHDAADSPRTKVPSCDLCESLLNRADRQIPWLIWAIDNIGDLVCLTEREETRLDCVRKMRMTTTSIQHSIRQYSAYGTRDRTCREILHCWSPATSNPTQCYDADEKGWTKCERLKCKVHEHDVGGQMGWIACAPGQGKMQITNSCRHDNAQEVGCSLLQCEPTSPTHPAFLCANPLPNYCYAARYNEWLECAEMKCQVLLGSDVVSPARVVRCALDQGRIHTNSCRIYHRRDTVACSLLYCEPRRNDRLSFICAAPIPLTCFADSARNAVGVNTKTWRACNVGINCWHTPTSSARCLDVHGQMKAGACKVRADQLHTTNCTDGMFCVEAIVEREERGFYCKTHWSSG